MATLSPTFEEFLPGWMAGRRWYRGTGQAPQLRRIGSVRWQDPHGEVGLETHFVLDTSGSEPVLYQVPLSYRAEPVDFMAEALVTTAEHSDLGTRYIYDAAHDPVFVQTLLEHVYTEQDVPSARARRIVAGGPAPALREATVLSGEQSNTSVVVHAHGETRPVIVKVFRVLQAGENPDVTVQSAIGTTGSRSVPGPIGYVEGRWTDQEGDGVESRGHLAFVQEFLPDTEDAWRVALVAARDETDFTAQARELGAATASVHAALREAFGTEEADAQTRRTLVEQIRRRADAALAEVPELGTHAQAIAAVLDDLEQSTGPLPLQRVHGDYHLGQVLHVPDRGWVLLDFEGEPLRPLAERTRPDAALRDVAGMLRSFDYAAASVRLEGAGDREGWATSAREAFLAGYADESADAQLPGGLLDALELDKALYEVVYEARNRPDWVPIPVSAVERLVERAAHGGRHRAQRDSAPEAGGTPGRHRTAEEENAARAAAAFFAEQTVVEDEDLTPAAFGVAGSGLSDLDPAVLGPSADDPESRRLVAEQPTAGMFPAGPAAQTTSDAGPAPAAPVAAPAPGTDPREALDGGWDPELDEPVELSAPVPGRASGAAPQAPVEPPVEMAGTSTPDDAALQAPAPAPAAAPQAFRASGGLPHAPVPAPEDMVLGALPLRGRPVRRTDVELAPRDYPPASGSTGRAAGDPEVLRARAWEEADSSPALRAGARPDDDGVVGDAPARRRRGHETSTATSTSGSGERVPLAAPTEPAAPHTLPLDLDEATDVVWGLHRNPHGVLGAHPHEGHVTIRTLQPEADEVSLVLAGGRRVPMVHETGGIWVAVLPQPSVPDYRLAVRDGGGATALVDEAYRHGPSLGPTDLHLIGEGRHEQLWRVLGSHVVGRRDRLGEVTGTRFAVWAPNALAVHVVGDFNGWDGARHALRVHEDVGVWEIFVPGVGAGAHYKYDITGPDGIRRAKADPMARASEVPPFNNSVVTRSTHRWGDQEWMARRTEQDIHHGPMSIYEVHLGSWRKGLNYEQLADELVDYVADMGFTHVEFMPVMQHPYGGSWGYHVTGYYAADSRFGHEDGLRYLVDRLHQAGVGVILDWVPGHFATDPWALARFDGTPIYEHPDPRKGWHPEWGSYIFDFGRPEVRNFLVANATYWLEEFHADGLRVDGVASMLYLDYSREAGQWIPNKHGGRENLEAVALLQEANAVAYRRNPGVVMIAEESTSWPGVTAPTDEGGLGFGFKWNMGWMHDTLNYLGQSPYARAQHHHQVTFALVYAFSEKYILPISHDEVVHGKGSLVRKMAGDGWQKLATMRAFLAYQWSHPGKQLLFMGSEFAQPREWADGGTLQWDLSEQPAHAGVQRLVRDLNHLYAEHPALWEIDHHAHGFDWLDANDAGRNQYSYLRWGNESPEGLRPVVAVVVNFSGTPHHQVHVGLPYGGRWREVLNTDAEVYGGSGVGNMGHVQAYDHPHQRQPFSALVTVPPMGAVWLVPDPQSEEELAELAAAEADRAEREPTEDAGGEGEVTEARARAARPATEVPSDPGVEVPVTGTEAEVSSPGELSEVDSFLAVEGGHDAAAEVPSTTVAETTPVGAMDLDQADAADGDLDAESEVEAVRDHDLDADRRS